MANEDPPRNPFIRWKQHVDAHIGLALNGLLGIPTILSKSLNLRMTDGGGVDGNGIGPGAGGSSSSSDGRSSADNNDLSDVDAAQLLEWHKFIYYSPYSPLKLQQDQQNRLLPPPVPQDVPFGADPYSFTYTDAFEDLLRASSRRPLLDLANRSYRNLRYQMRYGSAVEPPYVFFHRLNSARVLDAYFPRTAIAGSTNAPLSAPTQSDKVVQAATELAERAQHEDDDEFDDDDDFEHDEDDEHDWPRPSADPFGRFHRRPQGSLFDELDHVFRVLSRIIDEDTNVATANRKKEDGAASKDKHKADTEDELYTAVRSAYANAEKSLSTFVKLLSGIDDKAGPKAGTTTENTAEGSQTIRSTEDNVDVFGNRHIKTTVRHLDADGNEIARETHYSIRSPDQDEKSQEPSKANDHGDSPAKQPAETKNKNSGWFWK